MTKECFSDLLVTGSFLPAARKVIIDFGAIDVRFIPFVGNYSHSQILLCVHHH